MNAAFKYTLLLAEERDMQPLLHFTHVDFCDAQLMRQAHQSFELHRLISDEGREICCPPIWQQRRGRVHAPSSFAEGALNAQRIAQSRLNEVCLVWERAKLTCKI